MTRVRRRWWIPGILLILVAALVLTAYLTSRARCWQWVGTPVCRVDTSEKIVALTFDDGPTAEGVDYFLQTLTPAGTTATFFLTGAELAANPGQARRLVAAGHQIANHSYRHERMWGLFADAYEADIRRTDALLRQEGGDGALLFRPPYGKKLTGLPIALARTGHRTIMWDIEDPETSDPKAFADQILEQVRPGSIILVHAMYRRRDTARRALPLILAGLKDRGYRTVTVSDLLRLERPAGR